MRWQTLCAIDNCKALVPCQDKLRRWKRTLLGYEPDVKHQAGALADGCTQVKWLVAHQGTLENCAVLEIGTGWEPIIPLVYLLAGARIVYLTDLTNLLCEESLQAALECISREGSQICSSLQIPRTRIDEMVALAGSKRGLGARLSALNLRYLAPCDCRDLDLPTGSLDVIYSRAVLEHIPETVLPDIFREGRRLLKAGGLMCHIVDNSDHWEHRDKTISRVNFLQHSDRVMRFTCLNGQNYQNRLRHQDYVNLIVSAGFSVVRSEREIDQKALLLLPKLKLTEGFRARSHDDLAAISSSILAISKESVCSALSGTFKDGT